jgi:peptide/nickel transport system permease protein
MAETSRIRVAPRNVFTHRKAQSQLGIVWRELRRSHSALVGLVILVVLIIMAVFAPLLAPYDPVEMRLVDQFLPPSQEHLLGTDEFGRDIFSRILYGARISLQVGIIAVGIAAVIGTAVGLASGFYGRWFDMVSQRIIDVLLAFPGLLLALAIIAILGPGLENVMIAVGIGSIPTYARLVRGQTLSIKQKEYVEAATAIGASDTRLLVRHIFPNVVSPIIVLSSLGVAYAILSAAALSFIGLGAQPPTPEWGAMLSQGRDYMREQWWITTFPGVAIAITVLGFNLLGDGLRDALDPQGSR